MRKEPSVPVVPINALASTQEESHPDSVRSRASVRLTGVPTVEPKRRQRQTQRRVPVVIVQRGLNDLDPRVRRAVEEHLRRDGLEPVCVQVLSPTDAVVWNHPAPWPVVQP